VKLRSHDSLILALAFLSLWWPMIARADTLVLGDRQVFGKLVSMGSMTVRFLPACGTAPQDFPRSEVKRVERNSACKPRPIRPYSAGGDICTEKPLELYEVQLKRPSQTILASEVSIANGRMHIRTVSGSEAMHGSDKRFVSATRGLFCRAAIPPDPSLPEFCRENVPWAVNFGTDPVFDNRILTRGISFYLEDDDRNSIDVDDPRSTVVREAFGNAVTQWMGALQDLGPRLPTEAQSRLAGMISTSTGRYTLLTPPQVVRVGCPDTAMFIVRYLSRDKRPLMVNGTEKTARAQVAGRTIFLNGIPNDGKFQCWRASLKAEIEVQPDEPTDAICTNLTPIMVHELGHALGLPGHRNTSPPSIMDSIIYPDLIWPTADDAMLLANILLQPVQGSAAGRLDGDGMGVQISLTPRS
jgi:hypothetical protein